MIASLVPKAALGHTFPLAFPSGVEIRFISLLYANFNSLVFDYLTRQKIGGTHITFGFLKQIPVIPPEEYRNPSPWSQETSLAAWLFPHVLELTFTAWDLQPFARDCGYDGPPFIWDERRRFLLRAEIDAAYFHLYGIGRDDVAYILDSFPVVRKKDEARYGEYRTQRVNLDLYDRMAGAARSGSPYQSGIDPPLSDPRVAHAPRTRLGP